MTSLRIAALAFAALSAAMASGTVSAMPADGLAPAAKQVAGDVQDVRWMCGPYRCWRTPGPWGWPLLGPPPLLASLGLASPLVVNSWQKEARLRPATPVGGRLERP